MLMSEDTLTLAEVERWIARRMAALNDAVSEYEQLEAVLAAVTAGRPVGRHSGARWTVSDYRRNFVAVLSRSPGATLAELEAETGASRTHAYRLIKRLVAEEIIVKHGAGYFLIEGPGPGGPKPTAR